MATVQDPESIAVVLTHVEPVVGHVVYESLAQVEVNLKFEVYVTLTMAPPK